MKIKAEPVNTIRVIRKGERKLVKRTRRAQAFDDEGDKYLGVCWVCDSECICEDFSNGSTGHTAIDLSNEDHMWLLGKQRTGQLPLFD